MKNKDKTKNKAKDIKDKNIKAEDVKTKEKTAAKKKDGSLSQTVIRRGLTIAVMIFATLLIVSIALIIVVSKKIDSMSGADAQIKLSAQGGFTCEYSEAQKLYPYGDGVIKVTSERIAYLNLSGSEIFSQTISYQNPQCVTFGDYVAVFDRDGYSFTILDQSGVWYSKPTTNPIKSVQMSDNGFTAVISGSSDSFGEVSLYDKNGNQIAVWTSYNSGFPVCCAFNSDSTRLAVSTINTSGAVIVPLIRVFSINKTAKGYEVEDDAVFTTDDSVIFASICYVGNKLCCFTSNALYEVKDGILTQMNFDFSAIGYVKKIGNNLFVTYSDGISQLNKLAIINSSDSVIYNSNIGSNIICVAQGNGYYAINVDRRVFVYNSSGVITNDYSVDEDIIRMNFLSGNKLCVVSTGGVHTIT
ncbi:MAG: hypothetical protein IKE92_08825 [Clostridiales bacterium]|nr:hypothetical protein [Clostridiales bacterium]